MAGGPGKSFRRGVTIVQLLRMFPNDDAARDWFEEGRWPDGPICPHCGSMDVQAGIKHPTMTHRCRDCPKRRMFSLKTGTVMHGSPIGYQAWAIAVYLMSTGLKSISSMKLHRDLGITQKSAWFMSHRLREAYKTIEDPFLGPVEVDETYMGGIRKNMSKSKRKALKGTGPVGKSIVVGIKDRRTNRVSAAAVESADAYTLQTFIEDRVGADTKVFTDDAASYVGMVFDHESVRHSCQRRSKISPPGRIGALVS